MNAIFRIPSYWCDEYFTFLTILHMSIHYLFSGLSRNVLTQTEREYVGTRGERFFILVTRNVELAETNQVTIDARDA